jgi:hypothetical protein
VAPQEQQLAIVGALLALCAGLVLRENATYQAWTHRHPRGAAIMMGIIAATFVAGIWPGLLGAPAASGAVAAAFAAAAVATHRRLSQ